jgi:excinuclease ABC subunit C
MREEMKQSAAGLKFEEAARLRDEIKMLETLDERGKLDQHVQPEVFYIDPKKGLAGLKKILKLPRAPRTIEGVDIAHLGGDETVASLVQFIDGLPFKPGYRRYRIKGSGVGRQGSERGTQRADEDGVRTFEVPALRPGRGNDDFASIFEVVARRFRRLEEQAEVFPDILLIDGGKGQLNAGMAAFAELRIEPPVVISLAKREEEVYVPGREEPLRLSRHSYALRLLQYVRDEAHRFAQHYHHILRRKSNLRNNAQ